MQSSPSDRSPTAYDALPLPYAQFNISARSNQAILTKSFNRAFGQLFRIADSGHTEELSLDVLGASIGFDCRAVSDFIRSGPKTDSPQQLSIYSVGHQGGHPKTFFVYAWLDAQQVLHLFFRNEPDELREGSAPFALHQTAKPKTPEHHQHFDAPEAYQPCSYIYAAPFGTFVTDGKGKYVDVNPAACALSGYSSAELLQMNILDLIPPDSQDAALQFHTQLNRTGSNNGSFQLIRKDGTPVWCHLSAVKLSDDRFLGFHADISQQKEAEQQLEQERRYLAEIIEGTKTGTWRWNLQTGASVLNNRWGEILGYDAGEIYELTLDEWLNFLHPGDKEACLQLLDQVIAGERDIYECEIRMKHKKGHWVWIYDRGSVTDFASDGTPLMMSGIQIDITARKEAKEKLEQSERLFRLLFDGHSAVKLLIDADNGQIVDANKAAAAYYGWTREQLKQMKISDINTLSEKEIKLHMGEAVTKKENHYQFKHRKADGSIRDVEVFSSVIQLDQKKLIHSIIQDNTARFEAEEKYRREQKFNAALLESAQDGIVACDEHGRLKLFNEIARKWHNNDPDNSESPDWSTTYGLYDADGNRKLQPHEIPLQRAFRGERFANAGIAIKTKGMPVRYISASGGPFTDKDGRKLGAVVIMRDITEFRNLETQNKLQLEALRSTANAIAITDRDGNLEWINPAWEKLTGYTEAEVIGHNPRILKSGRQDIKYYKQLWDTLLSGEIWKGELMNKRKDGTLYHEYQTITPITNKEGFITHFIAIKQDISAQKNYENKLLAQNETLKRIAWHQSHVVRRPVANIIGLIDLLEDDYNLPDSQSSVIHFLKDEIIKLDAIVKEIVQQANNITNGLFDINRNS